MRDASVIAHPFCSGLIIGFDIELDIALCGLEEKSRPAPFSPRIRNAGTLAFRKASFQRMQKAPVIQITYCRHIVIQNKPLFLFCT